MDRHLLSIIIPTYHRPLLLDRAVRSCLDLGKDIDLQIIVSDDDSAGSGCEPLLNLASKHPHINVVYIKRSADEANGVSAARNRAIEVARGSYILFLDDDDYIIAQGMLNLLEKASESTSDLAICSYRFNYEDENRMSDPIRITRRELAKLYVVNVIPVGAYIIRRACCRKLFDTSIPSHEDWLFLLDNINSSTKILLCSQAGVIISQRDDCCRRSLSSTRRWQEDFEYIYEKHPFPGAANLREDMLARLRDEFP